MRVVSSLRTASRGPVLQVIKASVAAIVAWLICEFLFRFPQPPIFAAIAALLVVQPSVNQSVSKGIERSIGVIAGVALAFGAGYLFGTATWVVLAAIVVSLLLAWLFRLGPGSSTQIPISAMLVLSIGGLTPVYAVERITETIVGALAGLIVNLAIVPPVQLRPARLAVSKLVRELAAVLEQIADALSEPRSRAELDELLAHGRALLAVRNAAEAAIAQGRESLMLNPRGGSLRRALEHDEALFARLSAVRVRVAGMTRTVHDNWDAELLGEPTVVAIATELTRAAHDLRLLGRSSGNLEPETVTAELPALTAPLRIIQPHPDHWVLIGSLLEDLRRICAEIVGTEN